MFLGVDGCKRGWVCVALDRAGFRSAAFCERFEGVLSRHADAVAIAVDIPVGLCNAPRDADIAARKRLGRRASTVFPTPPRAALEATSYADAQDAARQLIDRGVSKQAFALAPRILEVDAFATDDRIHEVHPEVSFHEMNGGSLRCSKKTWGGLQERLALLRAQGIELPVTLGEADPVGIDDVVDAAAAAWSARRIADGTAVSFPDRPSQHDGARVIRIRA